MTATVHLFDFYTGNRGESSLACGKRNPWRRQRITGREVLFKPFAETRDAGAATCKNCLASERFRRAATAAIGMAAE